MTVVPHGTLGEPSRLRGPLRNAEWPGAVTACAVAATLALFVAVMGWRGSDLPAQLFRVELFRRDGFVLWNSQWFAGHPTLDYSVLSPVLGALSGPIALGAACGIASAFLFHRLVYRAFGASALVGSIWFATSTVTNLLVGRMTFALGLTFALGALFALQRRRGWIAGGCALLCALASPVAGVFLAVAAGAWGFAESSQRTVAWLTGAAAIVPLLAIAVEFPSPGTQPYEGWAFACDLALCVLFLIAIPERFSGLRWAAGLYAVVLTGTYLFASPLGGNVSRLNQYAAGPLLACTLWEYRRWVVAVLAIPLVFWQWFPTVDTITMAHNDPSTHRAYYQPLLRYLEPRRCRFRSSRDRRDLSALGNGIRRPAPVVGEGLGAPTRLRLQRTVLRRDAHRRWLSRLALRQRRRVRRAARRQTRPVVNRRSGHSRTRAALPRTRLAQRALAGLAVYRVSRSRRRSGAPGVAHGRQLHARGRQERSGYRPHSRVPHWAVSDNGCATATPDDWVQLRDLEVGEVRVTQALRGTPRSAPRLTDADPRSSTRRPAGARWCCRRDR